MAKIKAIVCPQCGSSDVTRIDEDDLVCNSCGCQFRIEQEKIINNHVVNNEIHYHINGEEYENLDKVNTEIIKLEKSIDEYALKRKTLIALCKKGVSYEEINKFDFKEPVVSYYSSMAIQMRYEVSYSASIGSYRDEVYYEPVRVYSQALSTWVTRNEKRVKTVTDWAPFSGKDVQEGLGSVCLNNKLSKNDVSPDNANYLINSFVSKNFISGGTNLLSEDRFPLISDVTSNDEKRILDLCQKNAFEKVCKGMPGDTHKQERCVVEKSTYVSKTIYYYPICKQEYVYEGTTFISYSLFTDGGESIVVIPKNAPIDTGLTISESQVKSENRREGKYVTMLVFAIILAVIAGIGFISLFLIPFFIYGSMVNSMMGDSGTMPNIGTIFKIFPIAFICAVGAILLFIFRAVGIKRETRSEFSQGLSVVKKKKIELCNRILKENGLYILTKDEELSF